LLLTVARHGTGGWPPLPSNDFYGYYTPPSPPAWRSTSNIAILFMAAVSSQRSMTTPASTGDRQVSVACKNLHTKMCMRATSFSSANARHIAGSQGPTITKPLAVASSCSRGPQAALAQTLQILGGRYKRSRPKMSPGAVSCPGALPSCRDGRMLVTERPGRLRRDVPRRQLSGAARRRPEGLRLRPRAASRRGAGPRLSSNKTIYF